LIPDLQEQRQKAWIGDAVLSLYARSWILREHGAMDGGMHTMLTSNDFLASIGNPTAIEAAIGRLYESEGLDSAFAWIEHEIIPRFQAQQKKRFRR
jgi:dsRNA-specific ribonuclease